MSKLYLIPNIISSDNIKSQLPADILDIIKKIDVYIVENIRTTRRFIKNIYKEKDINSITFLELNKHTDQSQIPLFLDHVKNGLDTGLISEAGVPCVADPGAIIVEMAHQLNIEVVPLVGPSSILLALMASGLNGQNFIFHGYLPIQKNERIRKIRLIEKEIFQSKQTQIFIETPFRNNQLLSDIVNICKSNTKLCVASEIFSQKAFIKTKAVNEWRKKLPDLNKRPVVFLLGH